MDSGCFKFYHEDSFDSRNHLDTYLSNSEEAGFIEDILTFPIENLHKMFREGHIKGDILIDLSKGSMVHYLYAACEFFEHILVLKISDRCIIELKRWVNEHTGAFDWQHAAKLHVDIEGNSEKIKEIEANVRSALQHVVKCDLKKENIIEPMVLPEADCVISAFLLDVISKNHDDYRKCLGKFLKLLKPGGHIILIEVLDATYFTIGKDKVHYLKHDENLPRDALVKEGFIIDCCEVKNAAFVSDLTDYKGVMFIVAHREK
ncbi:nicotinamide N-methyltransferase-like [Anomaloglossus baeobatrachus]|uniref:nicotinamide N-methyltransferase-like n=1 Tax=Anomaloglossus baeobatrachus TaxID=238106 RepID=UPI003F4F4F54